MSKAIVLYLHVHQPYRIRHYTVFDSGVHHDYFDADYDNNASNERILKKVAEKSYLPTNARLMQLLHENPEFKLSLSITGTVIEQLQRWSPESLESFKRLFETGRVEIVGETYYHSLAFFYSRDEFETQVDMHRRKVLDVFGQTPQVFRNTELAYNNDLAVWADRAGYKGILAEGWDPLLDWRSPNFVYRPTYTDNIRLLMKNYKLSDDIAFRFGDHEWAEHPLTADKKLLAKPTITAWRSFTLETNSRHRWICIGAKYWMYLDRHRRFFVTPSWPTIMIWLSGRIGLATKAFWQKAGIRCLTGAVLTLSIAPHTPITFDYL